jgi:hypothetical protein
MMCLLIQMQRDGSAKALIALHASLNALVHWRKSASGAAGPFDSAALRTSAAVEWR